MKHRSLLLLVASLVITISAPSFARDCPPAVGEWGYGPIGAIEVEGDLGLVASGAVLQVVDVSQPVTITVLGEIELPGVIRSLAFISDRWALAAAGSGGLWLVSLADPAAPAAIDLGFEDPVVAVGVGTGAHHAYVVEDLQDPAEPESRFTILDVNEPSSPDRLGSFEVAGSMQDMVIDGSTVYLAMADHALIEIDAGTPLWPSWRVQYPVQASDQGLPVRVEVCNGTIYFVTHAYGSFETNTSVHSLVPGSLSLNWTKSWMEVVRDIECAGDDLLLSGSWGMTALDVSVSPPGRIGGLGVWPGPSTDIEVVDERIFLADGLTGFKTYNGSDLSNIEQIGILDPDEIYFPGFASARMGNYLIGAGYHLSVVDVEDPSQPRLVATEGYGYFPDIVVSGSHAFVAADSVGVQVYDLSSPESPMLAGAIATDGSARQVILRNHHLLSISDTVEVFDVSSPTEPQLVTTIDHYGTAHLTDDDRLVVGNSDGLMVIDASDPTDPSIVGVLATDWNDPGSTVIGLTVRGDHAFVTTYASNPWRGGFHVVDLTRSRSPVLLGSVDLDGPAYDLIVRQDTVVGGMYKGEMYSGNLVTIDVADPTRPFVIAEIEVGVPDPYWQAPTPLEVYGLFDDGPIAYVSLSGRIEHALRVLDLADPAYPRFAGTMPAPAATMAVAADNGIAVTGEAGVGVRIFKIGGLGSPREVGFFDSRGVQDQIAVFEGAAYVDAGSDGLLVIDLAVPLSPRIANRIDLSRRGVLDVSDGHLYHATAWTLRVYDLADPLVPLQIGETSISSEHGPSGIAVDGGLGAMVRSSDFGGPESLIRVLDTSNPAFPTSFGITSHSGSPTDIEITGLTLFLTTTDNAAPGQHGLSIFDLADPTSPVLLSTTTTPGEATGVAVHDDVAYVSDSENGVLLLDISDPAVPVELGWLDTLGAPQALALDGRTLAVADGARGLTTFSDRSCPVSDPGLLPSVVD